MKKSQIANFKNSNFNEISHEDYIEYMELLAENLDDVLFIYNLNNFQGEFISSSIYKMTGFTPQEAIKHTIEEVMTKESVDYILPKKIERANNLLITGKTGTYKDELVYFKKDGSTYTGELIEHFMMNKKGIPIAVGIIKDITERKQIELGLKNKYAELEKVKIELEELNKQKETFIQYLSHQLKTPLISFKSLLKDIKILKKDEKSKTILKTINYSIENSLKYIQKILDINNLSNKNFKVEPTYFYLKELVELICLELNEKIKNKNLQILNQVPEQYEVFADISLLEQAVSNIIDNAIKFSKLNDTINIFIDKDNTIVIEDFGIGIPKEILNNLFDSKMKTVRKGTNGEVGYGIGLSFCKEIIELHKGKIEVESEEGKGTKFRIILTNH